MACDRCGMAAQGSLCSTCETLEHQEGLETPAEYMERQERESGGDES